MPNEVDDIYQRDVGRLVKVIFGEFEGRYGKVISRTATELELERTRFMFSGAFRVSPGDIKFID